MRITPSMQQYLELKKQYKDCILLFQMGDFYETFFDDAKIISKELNIILTTREKKNPIPMAGFPTKAIDSYLPKLINKGYKVAIAEQIEDPKSTKGLVKRKVIEVVTESTFLDNDINNISTPKQIASIILNNRIATVAITNISSDIITITKMNVLNLNDYFITQNIIELITNNIKNIRQVISMNIAITNIKLQNKYKISQYILKHFNAPNLMAIGLEEQETDIQAIFLILKYLEILKGNPAKNISKIKYQTYEEQIYLDNITLNNLEILKSTNNNPTLFDIFNKTKTPMGARLLFKNLLNPLKNKKEIQKRQNLINYLINDSILLNELNNKLNNIADIEKIASLINFNKIKPQQVLKLKNSLNNAKSIFNLIKNKTSLNKLNNMLSNPKNILNIINYIEHYINQNNSNNLTEGLIINANSFPRIKELRTIVYNTQEILESHRQEISSKFNLNKLKIGFNKIYGYFFEIPKTQKSKLPETFLQKQTLVNSIRFTTPKLQEFENKIQNAQEELLSLEKALYNELIQKLKTFIKDMYEISNYIAYIDFLINGAVLAIKNNYTKPKITNHKITKIIDGRHPILEQLVDEFIPNSVKLNNNKTFIILTGPNMGGKSTFIRQIALIQIIAQIGYYVPAKKAILSIKDRIFARVGATDQLSKNMSTFMVEMSEVANIINNATENSLIILDELGRGTSTLEGVSIAQSISEYIITFLKAHTLLTTHYYELTQLEKKYSNVQNLKVDVYDKNNTVIFLHKIKEGIAQKSYGIHIAKMVHLPEIITKRAKKILNELTQTTLPLKNTKYLHIQNKNLEERINEQPTLPINIDTNSVCKRIAKKLKKLRIEETTPLKALEFLNELQKLVIK